MPAAKRHMEHFVLIKATGASSRRRISTAARAGKCLRSYRINRGVTNMLMDFTSAETTAVMDWIEADEQRNQLWHELAQRALRSSGRSIAISKLSDALFDAVEQTLPHTEGLAGQLVPRVLTRVNFYEIAAALIREAGNETAQAA